MRRVGIAFLLYCMLAGSGAPAQDGDTVSYCTPLLQKESDLDLVYGMSRLVFIASIAPRPGPNPHIYDYRVLQPVLKGEVPEHGFVTFADECRPLNDEAIYLFLLDSMQEKIADANAVFFALTPQGPGYSWIAEWIRNKLNTQAPPAAEPGP